MKILLTGHTGQLGKCILKISDKSCFKGKLDFLTPSREELDLSQINLCRKYVRERKPEWIINTGAYTKVDHAEINKSICLKINKEAPIEMAKELANYGGKFLQISTDYVFGGDQNFPYSTSMELNPINFYGETKAKSEKGIIDILGANAYVLRTSWLYSPFGKNFLFTMLDLHKSFSRESKPIKVVCDQIGTPTSGMGLAECCLEILNKSEVVNERIFHWSDLGVTSWYDFAIAIGELSKMTNLLNDSAVVIPIRTFEYPTLAKRPYYSVLDTKLTCDSLNIKSIHWQERLKKIILDLKK